MIFIDSHVHIHQCFDLDLFLSSASGNIQTAAAGLCPGQSYHGVLCLTEDAGAREFDRLLQLADRDMSRDGWSVRRTKEMCSLIISHQKLGSLTVLAGRQIRCIEGVEVLALCTNRMFDDGVALQVAIDQVNSASGLAILPWGFGKWTGRRGAIVRQLMESRAPEEIFFGDNSGRLAFWREPAEFAKARRLGFRILPGSDPLPFTSEVARVASYGFAVSGYLSDSEPAQDLINMLSDSSVQIRPFGQLERPLRFIRNQLAMQLVKRKTGLSHA